MKKNYLFLAAASALVLASCSSEADTPKNPVEDNTEDVLTLTSLSPASQSNRIVKVNGTRDGEKKTRLDRILTIMPVEEAKEFTWSATGLAINGSSVYVTWHSDKQAKNPATKWGGALDVISYNANGDPTFAGTYLNYDAKFNSVIANNSAFYIALTDSKKGAAVARVRKGEETGIVRQLHGSSANALSLQNGRVYAVTGYHKGGVFSIAQDFVGANEGKANVDTLAKMDGCKWIDGNLVLRTDDNNAYIATLDGSQEWNLGSPLVSSEKAAEKYDPETGAWTTEGDLAPYYGKHTMAVDGDYIYVAGGKAEKGTKDGLRVYDKAGNLLWGNATNTTAVCVDGEFVYAATGAGLRVYKKFNGEKLELFAFETIEGEEKDKDGNPIMVAGTDAHSCNFVLVDGEYIYMANGQSGVYVFKLDKTAPVQEETPAED